VHTTNILYNNKKYIDVLAISIKMESNNINEKQQNQNGK